MSQLNEIFSRESGFVSGVVIDEKLKRFNPNDAYKQRLHFEFYADLKAKKYGIYLARGFEHSEHGSFQHCLDSVVVKVNECIKVGKIKISENSDKETLIFCENNFKNPKCSSEFLDFINDNKTLLNTLNESIINCPVPHPFKPVVKADSKILILGSFPPISSIEAGFYYGFKNNAFWEVLDMATSDKDNGNDLVEYSEDLGDKNCFKYVLISKEYEQCLKESIKKKKDFLKKHKIALWDSIALIENNPPNPKDNDLKIINPNDIYKILDKAKDLKAIACGGGKAQVSFRKWLYSAKKQNTSIKYKGLCAEKNEIIINGRKIILLNLPSTSSNNYQDAASIIQKWRAIKAFL